MRTFFILVDSYINLISKIHYPYLCRSISAVFLISHGIRRDSSLHIYSIKEKICLCFFGDKVRQIRPDEASTLGLLKKAYRIISSSKNFKLKNIHSGVFLKKIDLATHLKKYGNNIFIEDKNGRDIIDISISPKSIFILNLNIMPQVYKKIINYIGKNIIKRIRISRCISSIDQLIVLINNNLDRKDFHDG